MQKVLELLIDLQEIDAQLLMLQKEKGDLPMRVDAMSEEINQLEKKLAGNRGMLEAHREELALVERNIDLYDTRLNKYKTQLYQVRNNREYDAISNEIDAAVQAKSEAEARKGELSKLVEREQEEIARLEALHAERQQRLAELQKELEAVSAQTREKEEALTARRNAMAERLPRPIVSTYERIRTARGGYALAFLRNGACSQCSTRIPPQRGLEIRMMNRIHLCEVCGRILVWKPELTETE
ncbi:MAG: hypothetical protein ONB24_03045 [candidate division KSB1 bacterium]|nr:hypothetical protein [candidate division KSB1 bacterium]